MRFGKSFWFWIRILLAALKALRPPDPKTEPNPPEPGERVFDSVLGQVVEENEDDEHKASEVKALLRK